MTKILVKDGSGFKTSFGNEVFISPDNLLKAFRAGGRYYF